MSNPALLPINAAPRVPTQNFSLASLPDEVWKPVITDNGFWVGWYEVSNLGRVRAKKRQITYTNRHGVTRTRNDKPKIIAGRKTGGYFQVVLRKNGTVKQPVLHRLVADAFIPNVFNKPQVNHIDGDKLNNVVSNLEWVTSSENCWHAFNVLGYDRFHRRGKDGKIIVGEKSDSVVRFTSLRDAERCGFNRNGIKWNIAGKVAHHQGYQWHYE